MKTVESARLYFKNEKSDKIYEVDLCEVEDGLYIVNFRYGKRNSNLREGTKTVFPVSYEEAKRSFDQLVLSKTTKGYNHVGQESESIVPVQETTIPETTLESDDSSAMRKVILRNLKDLKNANYTKDWIASRIIWRAGELKIDEAEGYLKEYLKSTDFQEQYASVWALGRLKSSNSVNELYTVFKSTTSATIKTLCIAALLDFENQYKLEVKQTIENALPSLLKDAISAKNSKSIKNGIKDFTKIASKETALIWTNLYLLSIENNELRSLLKEELQHISTKRNDFKAVRKIYKLAEFRDDFEFLAICAKKTAINTANYKSNSWAVVLEDEYVEINKEKVKPDSKLAFSSATKTYFNKRTLRRLKKTLTENLSNYIDLATEILLSVSDQADKQKEFSTYTYNWENNWELTEQWHPKYHLFAAYNFILYDNSDRFKVNSKNKSYSYLAGSVPDKKPIVKREEHNSAFWDNAPEAIIRILAHAQVAEVNDFALKVFKANPHFKNAITEKHLALMASSIYEATVNLTVELIKEIYAGKTLPFELIIGLLSSSYILATNLGKDLLQAYIEQGNLNTENILQIILFGRSQLLEIFEITKFSINNKEQIQFSQIAALVFDTEKYNEEFIRALMKFISQDHVRALFAELTPADLEQFISAKENYLKEFGLLLIRLNTKPTHELAAPKLDSFLNSDDPLLRAAAIELLAEFPEEFLLHKTDLVMKFVFAEHKELRQSIVSVVKKLLPVNEEFRKMLFSSLLTKICEQEEIEGSNDDHLSLLQNYFAAELSQLDNDLILELLLSSTDAAQKIGEQQFHEQSLKQQLKLNDWVELKDSDVFSVREELERFYTSNVKEIMANLDEALKVLESKWADVRNWAMRFFSSESKDVIWTLEQVLQVADSPKEDVQSFARSLISQLFSSTHGNELMVHLSEHPSRSMMLFNSNYLNLYAKDNPEVIIQLKQYFKNILYGVNLGSASKARVYAFLMQELKKDEQVAKMTLAILSEILVTSAIGDKSSCIDLTLAIGELYPHLELPISVSPLNTYSNAIQS